MIRERFEILGALGAAIVLAGCLGTETGNPPTDPEDPPEEQEPPELEEDRLHGMPDVGLGAMTVTVWGISGETGAVDPAEGTVVVTNLDNAEPPVRTDVRDDGTFSLEAAGEDGDVFRIEAIVEGVRSDPVDRRANEEDRELQPVMRPLADCFVTDPKARLAFTGDARDAQVAIDNGCDERLELETPRLRTDRSDFAVEPTEAFELAPDATANVEVRLQEELSEGDHAILFIEVTSPQRDRRPVTLYDVK